MTEMQEALSQIEGRVQLAPEKIPAGSTLVGIRLERDESRAHQYTEAVGRNWQVTGWAIALKDGHVIAGNALFGRWTGGVPKVTAMHWCRCSQCGSQVPMPVAVWAAKDAARKGGVEIEKDMPGIDVLRKHGKCNCGGRWVIDDAFEKEVLAKFADETLKTFSIMDKVDKLLPPAAFLVDGEAVQLEPEWAWLQSALSNAGHTVSPFVKDGRGSVLLYNPGLWLGWVEDKDSTNLFWVENGVQKGRRHAFDPKDVDGI